MFDFFGILKGILIQNEVDRSKQLNIQISPSATTGTSTTIVAQQTANRTLTLPDNSDTLSTPSATETLTNKTINGNTNTIQNISISSLKTVLADASNFLVRDASGIVISNTKAVPTGTVVGTSDLQTLTNKTLTAPVISSPTGITKSDVGLSNVDNTSDATKNAASVTLTNKTLTTPVINSPTGITKSDVGLSNVDNTSDATKNSASVTLTNKTLTSPVINTPTGIVKGDVGLGNVDNTSDATKNSASVTLTNKTFGDAVTFTDIATPSNPAASFDKLYFKSDHNLYTLNPSGIETQIGVSSVPNLSIVSKTTTYTAATSDDVILCSSSSFTVTLYAASGNSGKQIRIVKTDSTLANIITVKGNASELINGANTTTLNTIYEDLVLVCDGTGWYILSRQTKTQPVAYTPSIVGWNSFSNGSFYTWRDGNLLWFTGRFQGGTSNASSASVSLGFNGTNTPSGLAIDTSIVPANSGEMRSAAGNFNSSNTGGANGYIVMQTVSSTTSLYFTLDGQTTINSGATLGTSTLIYMGMCAIPISGWNN